VIKGQTKILVTCLMDGIEYYKVYYRDVFVLLWFVL